MAEYIEREAAKNAFPRAEADAFENCRYCTCLDSEQIGEILDNIPAADVLPVRHGRWIKDCDRVMGDGWTYTQRHCSECGGQTVECVNYCQFCGAKMDKDGDGDGTIN